MIVGVKELIGVGVNVNVELGVIVQVAVSRGVAVPVGAADSVEVTSGCVGIAGGVGAERGGAAGCSRDVSNPQPNAVRISRTLAINRAAVRRLIGR